MIKFNITIRENAGVLFKDEEIVCIKDNSDRLLVYSNDGQFDLIVTLQLPEKANQIGKYVDGVYYFHDKKTFFYSFDKGIENVIEGNFYFRFYSNYTAYISYEKRDKIIFESHRTIEIPILQKGGKKLFLSQGLVQAEQTGTGEGSIVYNSLSEAGKEIWRHAYSELTESDSTNLYSQILCIYDKLFFVLAGDDGGGLFCLDVKSGNIIKKFPLSRPIFLDNDMLYTSQYENVLCRVNTKTLELEEWNCNDLIKENGFLSIHDHRCDVVNGEFCFTQTLGDDKAKLGVLDWDKKELIYKHNFEPQNGAIGSIHVSETRMFVHTQDNTLHIFEKE